jgi:hypothetical protein
MGRSFDLETDDIGVFAGLLRRETGWGRESSQRLGYFLEFAYLRYGTDLKGPNNTLVLINLTTDWVEVKSMLWKELHAARHSTLLLQ